MAWESIDIAAKVLSNVKETALKNRNARVENAYINDQNALCRFPFLEEWITLPASGVSRFPVYLSEWRGDLMAVSGGRVYRIDVDAGTYEDVTGAAVTGTNRVIFAQTEEELLMAAGKQIISLRGNESRILSRDAPESTHVVFIKGYVVAIEPGSGRFYHSAVGQYDSWNPIDVFSAEGKPDNLNAAHVTDFNELLLCGPESIEQHDPSPSGTRPFFLRWTLGAGLFAPYTIVSVDNRVWGVNQRQEFVSFSSQASTTESRDVQVSLEMVDDWRDAWSAELPIDGQRFIILQCPHATNIYGTKGLTFLYDYQKKRWGTLYGPIGEDGLPTRWQGWSVKKLSRGDDVKYVGGEGKIYRLRNFGVAAELPERMRWRSGFFSMKGNVQVRVDKVRVRLRRGDGAVGTERALIGFRSNKDNKGFGHASRKSLGLVGDTMMSLEFPAQGAARAWQFEIEVDDRTPVEIHDVQADLIAMES